MSVVPIKEAPTYKADDIVTAVSIVMDVGGSKISFNTHVMRDCDPTELRETLDKLTNAGDWLGAKYSLRNLKLQLEQEVKQLNVFREEKASYLVRAETEWSEIGKRRGEVVLSKQQQANVGNYENSIKNRIQVIEKVRKDIAIMESVLKGTG